MNKNIPPEILKFQGGDLAESQGFEPWVGYKPTHDFQSNFLLFARIVNVKKRLKSGIYRECCFASNAVFTYKLARNWHDKPLKHCASGALSPASHLQDIVVSAGEFVNLIRADFRDGRAVKRTVSIPKWMDDQVSEASLSLSRVLEDALKEKLNVG